MKIVYSISATHNSGGMERVLTNKANYLVEAGHDVVILTTDQRNRAPYFRLDPRIQCIDLGINYTDNAGKGLLQKLLSYPAKQKEHRRKLRDTLQKIRADVAISMFDHDAHLLWRIADGSKKILEIHFSRFKRLQYGRRGLWKLVDRWRSIQDGKIARRYDRFVVLTQEDSAYWGGASNIRVIPNAATFAPARRAALENKKVIAIGRYDYQKNFEALIEAWQWVYREQPDWQLSIYGEGELKTFYERRIEELGLSAVVTLCPPTRSIQDAYMESSILAMSSRYEGLPMALLEAQACGVPLVSFACKCGPKDVIDDGINGYLVAEGDTKGLARALVRIMENVPLRKRMGRACVERAEMFSQNTIMKRWLNLFEEI